jgi:hypothetical protein
MLVLLLSIHSYSMFVFEVCALSSQYHVHSHESSAGEYMATIGRLILEKEGSVAAE